MPKTLEDAAVAVLRSARPEEKVALTRKTVAQWRDGALELGGRPIVPDRPERPAIPALCPPNKMPKRSFGSTIGRQAFLHAIAHIELNAVDLAWDVIARFGDAGMPRRFFDDWTDTALDEAKHFTLLEQRLEALGARYGDFDAHDGLWEAATATFDDLKARMALVPMVLEARGLDTAQAAADKLRSAGDHSSAELMETIGQEEIPHVAVGVRWFEFLCHREGMEPIAAFHDIIRQRFSAKLKPPFNREARERAGMDRAYYAPLS